MCQVTARIGERSAAAIFSCPRRPFEQDKSVKCSVDASTCGRLVNTVVRCSMDQISISVEDPAQPEILTMLAESDAYYAALYPAESIFTLDVAALQRPEVTFFVARIGGRASGFGSYVRRDG